MDVLPKIILLIVLTLINAFFASAEMAIVSVNRRNIESLAEKGNKKAIKLIKLMNDQTKFLSTIQVGITFAGFFSSASAATNFADNLAKYLERFAIPTTYTYPISIFIVTIVLAYFTLVFGELYPKRVALQKAEKIALSSAGKISVVRMILDPFVRLLSASTNLLLKITKMKKENLEELVSEEEIKRIIEAGRDSGVINNREEKMIEGIFQIDDYVVTDIMTPRKVAYMINLNDPIDRYLDEMLDTNYSRIPVYDNDIDNIVGILYIKDFFREARKYGFNKVNIKKILKKPLFVPVVKKVEDLFLEMQEKNNHMAIIIDEFGGLAGIITLEDIVEEIVGNIYDEYDEEEIKKISENVYLVKGIVPIQDLIRALDLDLDNEDESYDTLAGLIINLLGRIPSEDDKEEIHYRNLIFKIEKITNNYIENVKIIKLNQKEIDIDIKKED